MFKKEKRIIGTKQNLNNYVEGYDVYNSYFLHVITDPTITKTPYEITVYEYRPDLIAEEFYGSKDYLGILLVQTGLSLEQYTRGTILELIPKYTIDLAIGNM